MTEIALANVALMWSRIPSAEKRPALAMSSATRVRKPRPVTRERIGDDLSIGKDCGKSCVSCVLDGKP